MDCNTVFGGRTPIFGGRTPIFGDRTPKFGGRTLNLVAETLISYSNDFLNNTGTVLKPRNHEANQQKTLEIKSSYGACVI